jgi:YggT family protein
LVENHRKCSSMIRALLDLYMMIIFVDIIASYLPQYHDNSWRKKIKKAADLTCGPARKILPANLPFDFSPLIVFVAYRLIMALW